MKTHLVDRLLLDSQGLAREIQQDRADARLVPRLLTVVVGAIGFYGLAVGLQAGLGQAAATAVKLPLVVLVAAGLGLPLLHVGCALAGFRLRLDQLSALVLQALATASVTMAGLAPFVVVTWLSLSSACDGCVGPSEWWVYRRVFLVGLAVAGLGGLAGAARLLRAVPLRAAVPWALTFGLAGLQMSWLLRPIVGMPGTDLVLLRPIESNAITEVLTAFVAVL